MKTRTLLTSAAAALALVGCSGDAAPAPSSTATSPVVVSADPAACSALAQVRGELGQVEGRLSQLQSAPRDPTSPPDPTLEGQRQSLLSRQAQLRAQEPALAARCGR